MSVPFIILLYAEQAGLGKTTLANRLIDNCYVADYKASFAEEIKRQAYILLTLSDVSDISWQEFKQDKKDEVIEQIGLSPRDLTILHSDYMQSIYGDTIWAEYILKKFLKVGEYCVIDDWRRTVESKYLVEKLGKHAVITVYLSKEDVKISKLNDIGNTYEGQINKSDCDIVFEFNKDWSNTDQLIEMINKRITDA